MQMANRLSKEQSPYLQQHAHNPVDWYPWGDEAFALAKSLDKPVLVSIGYSACHWCHVMERESFENEEVAALMNEQFVCIKVDREEHPDVDDFYMSAVQTLTGSGGWPLNVFVTPDRKPFYGGTYFPPVPAHGRPSWTQLLERMAQVWQQQKDEVFQQSEQLLTHLQQAARQTTSSGDPIWSEEQLKQAVAQLLKQGDTVHGGFGRAPKFPATMSIQFLLEQARFTGNKAALTQALLSLDKMIAGGIYDQLGGGFARYSVDTIWLVPHFEKMLYDNAMLLSVLCDAYRFTKSETYKEVIEETIAFLQREMRHPEGGYYAALDADSEGVEGKFYCWDSTDWKHLMGDFPEYIGDYFGISESGNWEETNILHRAVSVAEICRKYGVAETNFLEQLQAAKRQLMTVRNTRIRPGLDDKILLSWNALMNLALTKAAAALDREDWLSEAVNHMNWLCRSFDVFKAPKHCWKAGLARIDAKLDDLAFLIRAMIELAQATGTESYLLDAQRLCAAVLESFASEEGPLLFYTAESQKDLPYRRPETYDGVTPSSNAVMAESLYLLGLLSARNDWMERAKSMLAVQLPAALRYPSSFAHWATLVQRLKFGYKTIVFSGANGLDIQREIAQKLLPNCFYFFEKSENFVTMPFRKGYTAQSRIFVCTETACLPPFDRLPENIDFAIL
jgi:uncharacterized protein YyaL (SSP411 family)